MDNCLENIFPTNKRHIKDVVLVHISSFPDFFLSELGSKFLFLFYSRIVEASEGIAFVYLNDSGIPTGFVAGTSNPRGFYSRLLKRDWLAFALAAIPTVLRKPAIIGRVARAVFHPSDNPVGNDLAGLFSIGVLPEQQRTGVGKKLVQAFLKESKRRGCNRVFLTTDQDHNDAVNAFYVKHGFSVKRRFVTPEGRRMNEYWITLPEHVL